MPVLTEIRGEPIRRFVWWKLRFENGQWVTWFSDCGRVNFKTWERI